ncbi:MAG: tetratricopeptide repeat protein [Rickettsiaceae bacterium]|nr:tetratricopeptide repeat protein [Rickettsiaceae bacterium]
MKYIFLVIIIITSNNAFCMNKISNEISPVTYFVNHVSQLEQIKNNLTSFKKATIVGISGMGKTQLARMYAKENQDKYNIIWFIDCNLDINDEFIRLAREINKIRDVKISENAASVTKEVMHYLASKDKWLLVFDNLKINSNHKVQDFISWDHNGDVIFCAQDSQLLPYVVRAEALREKDVKLLSTRILEADDDKHTKFLFSEFKGYPILVVQGAQLLKEIKGLSQEEYKKKLNGAQDKIRTNIELAISPIGNNAKNLLFKIALMNNQRFSKKLASIITDSPQTLDDDLYKLSKFVLITCVDSNESNPIFEMHDVVASNIRGMHTDEANKLLLETIIDKIVKSMPDSVYEAHMFRNSPTIHENLEVLLQNERLYNPSVHSLTALNLYLLVSYCNSSDFYNAEKLVKWFEERDKKGEFKLSFMDNYQKRIYAGYLNMIGTYIRKRLSDHNLALVYYNRSIEVFKDLPGEEWAKFNLFYVAALSNISLGKIEEGIANIKQMDEVAASGKVPEGDLGLINRIKSKLHYYQGRYEEALLEIDEGIKKIISNGLKTNDPVLTTPYVFRAMILNRLGRYNESYSQIEQLFQMHASKKEDHLVYGRIFAQKARALLGMKQDPKYATSKPNQEQITSALEDINKSISILLADTQRNGEGNNTSSEDEDLAEAYVIQGDIYFSLKDLKGALESYRKAQGIYFHLYKEQDKEVAFVSYLYTQGAKASCDAKNSHYYTSFRDMQVKAFGHNHPDTIEMFRYCKLRGM